MEVKLGYKLTEVGVIPEDWDSAAIGEITDIRVGRDLQEGKFATERDFLYRFPVYSNTVANRGLYGFYSVPEYEGESLTVVGRGVGLGTAFFREDGYGAIGRLLVLLPSPCINANFLATYINQQVRIFFETGGIPQLTGIQFSKYKVALPSLSEQRAIAAALSDVDALLDGLDRLIAKKRDLKQAAMQQLLTGQTRLPGFSGEWDQVKLDELFSFKNGLNKAKEFFGYGTPIVNYMDVFASSAIYPSKLDGRVSLSNAELKNFDVKKGDVFFTRTSETIEEVGIAAVMLDDPIETVFSGFVLRARPLNERLNDEYKAYCFRSDFVRKQITSKASYTTRALTNGRILSEVILPLPSLVEQTAIATILSDMDAEITALEARRDKTHALKQGMMQELLTGRIRLV